MPRSWFRRVVLAVCVGALVSPALAEVPALAAGLPATVTISPGTVYTPADSYYTAISATVLDSSGAPVADVPVSWSASGNATFSSTASVTDAQGVATTSVSAENGWGRQTITATSGTVSGTATMYGYGCAAVATLTLAKPYLPASGPLSTAASVLVTDSNSPPDPIPGLQLQFSASGDDTVGPYTDNGDGTYSATVTAYGAGTQTITVSAPNQCGATGSASLDVYGAATNVALSLTRTSFPATGVPQPQPNLLSITGNSQQSAEWMPAVYDPEPPIPEATATVTDSLGDRVPADTVTFAASGGITFDPTVANGDGTYSAEMVSSATPGTETVTATDTTAGVTSAGTAVAQTFGALHTSGTLVEDTNNKEVFFRGINMGPDAPAPYLVNEFPENAPNDTFYDTAQSWGANFVRAQIDSDQWMQSCPTGHPDGSAATSTVTYDPYYRTAFEEYVRAATERGMFVLLALGRVPRFLCDPGGSLPQIMADRDTGEPDDSVTFWKSVAQTFKDNPLVGFEPYNEPHITSSDIPAGSTETPSSVWLNGGLVDNGTWTAEGMQEMYDAIRSTGAGNLVFVDGPNWANTPPPYLISSPASASYATDAPAYNIVYVVHYYTCANPGTNTPYACSPGITAPSTTLAACPSQTNPPAWDDPAADLQQWVPWRAANDVPVMEDEFGWPSHIYSPVDGCFDQATISFDEANDIPWAVFNMVRYEEPWSVAFYNSTPNYAPTVSGAVVKPALAANSNEVY